MKKWKLPLILGIILGVSTIFGAETFIVKVRSSALRSGPQFFASTVIALKAGDGLLLVSRQADWIQAKSSSGQTGWIHQSAVEPKKIDILAWGQGTKTQATASEVAMAAKGFNKQVEDSYKAKNKNISFVWVDKMAQIAVTRADLQAFLKQGKLAASGGSK
ncbi:MAG: SH3 domain-containing protein [Candidatus Aminicenantes bacterium]|nr:SH3 domain-containing protein [Candidatus Aminicenantes bacterium]